MTVPELMAELSSRFLAARKIKEAAWDSYTAEPSSSEVKWKLKVQWQQAAERTCLLQKAIQTIKAEKLA